ncbi:phage tail protein [Pseudomonas sp. W2Jun17]|uniref:TipJ family phage tail tip protein n=1 Tax=Pseudomonas sp. W2Jun17 TaxID=1553460 RepID=UPI00200525DC|nr:phage tail protein [Pseudomonas sp. W2Jun17]MCK3852084.1 DUF1983 domain-containing protein [Pseudomonas sp. W2Jun17]
MSAATKKPARAQRKRRAVVGSKGGEAKQKQPVIASNSVPSLSRARIVYLWSWGPIVGPVNGLRSVRLNGTPVQGEDGTINYPGVKWQFRSGELNQERLEGISESSNEIDVKKELQYGTPWLHTITNAVADAIRLRFSWPTLRKQDSAGNIDGVRIDYAVDISTDGGPFLEVLTSFVDRKNLTEYERAHRIELPAGSRWTIRARRLTPEANSDLVVDQMLVKAIAEVVDSDQEFPLTAVGCIEYDAQVFGGDIAKIAVLMRGRIIRVPTNYDAATRTYATSGAGTSNGIWDGTFKEAYTNNPAWIFYDLVLHPYYGLGDRIDATMVDRWALYRIAQYCDQLVPDGKGGQEPRFTCNLYLQKQTEAYAVLQDLASIFRGMAFWDGSQIVVNADMPGDPVFSYGPAQILNNGAIKYEGTRVRDRHTNAMVSWDNPDQGFETDKEPVFDDVALGEYGSVRELTVDAFGCTSLGQAQRAGQWALMTEQLQTRGAVFRVGLDGQIPKPGQVIGVGDPMLAGRANSGRISSVAGRVITLDREVVLPAAARLMINLPSGKSEGRAIKSVAGRDVTVMADYSETPTPELGWAIDSDDLKVMQFYVRNVTRPEWHQFQLEVIQYEPSKFDVIDHGAVVDPRPISGIPIGTQDAPVQVLLSQHVVIEQGIAITVMSIAWDAAPGAVAYDVEWKWGAREWIRVPRTAELVVDVRGIYSGQYMARVRAVSALNVSSIPTASMLTNLEGKTGLPPAVSSLTTKGELFGISIKWGFPAGAEDTQRTELWYGPANNLEAATKLADLAYPQADYRMQSLLSGATLFFWARLVDRTGNIGPFYPTVNGVMGQSVSDAWPLLEQVKGQIDESSLAPALNGRIDLIDGDGPGSVNARNEQLRKDLEAQIKPYVDALLWDAAKAYAKGDIVRQGNKLYQALAANSGSQPPSANWKDVGDILTDANALAIRVDNLDQKITVVDGKVIATQDQLTQLQTKVNDPVTGLAATANNVTQVNQRVDNVDDKLTAQTERIDGVYAEINAPMAGSENDLAGGTQGYAGVWSIQSAITDGDYAQGKLTQTVEAQVIKNYATYEETTTALVNQQTATTNQVTALRSDFDGNKATVQTQIKTVSDQASATASQTTQLQTTVNGHTQQFQQQASINQDVNGKITGTYSFRFKFDVNGSPYSTGVGLGIETDANGQVTSRFVIQADQFAIYNGAVGAAGSSVPFAVNGTETYIKSAFIQDGTITNAKIGAYISSTNYIAGQQGWILNKDGTFEINGVVPGQGRSIMTNRSLRFWDANGVKRVQLGDQTE